MQKVKTVSQAMTVALLGALLFFGAATTAGAYASREAPTLFFSCYPPSVNGAPSGYTTSRVVGYVHTANDHRDVPTDLDCDSRNNGGSTYDHLPFLSSTAGPVTSMVFVMQVVSHKADGTVIAMSFPLVSTNNYTLAFPIADPLTGNGEAYFSITYP